MYTGSDLEDLGKQLASDRVQGGQDLTGGLRKVASQKGLTQQQVNRVAEVANVESYLKLMKTADDSYIEFDLADPSSVSASKESLQKSADTGSDYDSAPEYQFDVTQLFDGSSDQGGRPEGMDKSAKLDGEREIKDKISFLNNKLAEAATSYEQDILNLTYTVKQAHLKGTDLQDIYSVVKQASPEAGDHFWNTVEGRLSDNGIKVPENIEEVEKTASPNSDIYKKASNLEDQLTKVAQVNYALEYYRDQFKDTRLYDEDQKTYDLEKVGGIIGGTLEFIKERPKWAGSAVLGTGLYQAGKTKGKNEQGEIIYNVLKKNRQYGQR